jgi:hypothetical protein
MRSTAIVVFCVVALSACGGNRPTTPIAVMRLTDAQLTCDGIENEIVANEVAVNARRSEIDQAQMMRTYNAVAGGLIGAATSEDGSAARVEIDAYTARSAHLRRISRRLKC